MNALFLEDCYVKEWNAVVIGADGNKIVLDSTAFYPTGGGQPNDTGTIICNDTVYSVINVIKENGIIFHELDKGGLKNGDAVNCKIDWSRRHKLMRHHTAAHILSGIVHARSGAKITGNQLGIDQSRIDFSLESFNKDEIKQWEQEANRVIASHASVNMSFVSPDSPLAQSLLKVGGYDGEQVRIVNVQGINAQPCGGTHVSNTKEIGTIEIVRTENKGKNNRRIYYVLK